MSAIPRFDDTEPLFDETDPLEGEAGDVPRETSGPEAFGLGAAQGATLGFADEIAAAAKTGFDINRKRMGGPGPVRDVLAAGETALQAISPQKAVADYLIAKFQGKAPEIAEPYRENRDAIRQTFKTAGAEHPKTTMAGELAGGIATSLIPGAQAATLPKMAGYGAAVGLGSSEADLTQGDTGQAALDTASGAGTGLAFGAGMKGLQKAVNPQAWRDVAGIFGRRTTGFTKRLLNNQKMRQDAQKAVESAIENKIIAPGRSHEEMLELARKVEAEAGDRIGAFLKLQSSGMAKPLKAGAKPQLREQFLFDPKQAAGEIEAIRSEIAPARAGHYTELHNALDEALETIQAYGERPIPWEMASEIKRTLQKAANYNQTKSKPVNDLNKSIAGKFLDYLDTKLEEVAGARGQQEGFEQFLKDKKTWGAMSTLETGLNNAISSGQGNRAIGLTDFLALGAGGSIGAMAGPQGGIVTAGATLAAKKALDVYGPGASTVAATSIADVLQKTPEKLGKYAGILSQAATQGSQQLAIRHFVLQQQDPEYQSTLEALEKTGANP